MKQRHLLVIRLSAMGDVAMLAPVIRCVLAQNEHVKITILSRNFLKPIFDEEILGEKVSFFTADTNGKHKGFFGLYKLAKELKKLNITEVVDVHNVLRSKILRTFLFGRKNAFIDKGRTEKNALTRTNDKVFKQLQTTHERYADVFRELNLKVDLTKHQFPKKPINISLAGIQESKKKWIGIAPFAQYSGKMYPLDLMEEVIKNLSKENELFLFGGGHKEIDLLNALASKYTHVKNVAGELNLKEELQLIANLDIMLAMDSGNAHFSAMFGVKTVTIWGVTHPFAGFAPFLQQNNCIVPDIKKYPNLPCSIYGNKVCDGYENVMRSISVTEIIKKIID